MRGMEDILKHFEILNFSQTETTVYLTILKNESLNGSQVSKCTGFALTILLQGAVSVA